MQKLLTAVFAASFMMGSVTTSVLAADETAAQTEITETESKSEGILEIDPEYGDWHYLRTEDALKLTYTEDWYKDVKLEYDVKWYGLSGEALNLDDQGILHANRQGKYEIGYDYTYTAKTWETLREKYPDEIIGISDVGRNMYFVVSEDPYIFRLYNPNSGEHFYTSDQNERKVLIQLGWKNEGYGWLASDSSNTPVYRLYDPNAGDHHYTMNIKEYDALAKLGWKQEGVAWYCNPDADVPVYRQYNPNAKTGRHNYTANTTEKDHLISIGWKDEGIAWYTPVIGTPDAE
ncbi:hypothetical protein [Allobaculum mucilyticum]|uniref:hypothetical protein n=1 Tax=Allobaculum mucilyticum TaxID=2834459 RepID=UPI001E4A55EE|nr:hypothetical protein [Allobaculum mucilyticum]UNT96348.1 hypothetical protein KWG62_00875 [Allobaculum mucilyticum]